MRDTDLIMAIEHLISICHFTAKSKGWWDEPRRDGEIIALMHSELSECLEAMRNKEGTLRIAEELADCCIRIFDYCGAVDIDLGQAILEKIEVNKTRPYKHGGKEF